MGENSQMGCLMAAVPEPLAGRILAVAKQYADLPMVDKVEDFPHVTVKDRRIASQYYRKA